MSSGPEHRGGTHGTAPETEPLSQVPTAAVTSHRTPGGLNKASVFAHTSGGQMCETTRWQGRLPWRPGGRVCPVTPLGLWCCRACVMPSAWAASPPLPLSSRPSSHVSLCASHLPLLPGIRGPVFALRIHPECRLTSPQDDLHLQRPYFQMVSHSQTLRFWTWTHLWGPPFNPLHVDVVTTSSRLSRPCSCPFRSHL